MWKWKPDAEFQYSGRGHLGEFNGMSSQSHVSHCRVLPHSEFTVMFPEPHAKLCHVPTTDASSLHYRLNVNTSLTIPGVDAMQRVVDALHAGRRRPACSLHAGRIVRPELTCQFSAYNSIVLFLFLAA